MTVRVLFASVATVLCCGCYDTFDAPADVGRDAVPNTTIRKLRDFYYGKPFVVHDDMVVGGYVTSSDKSGNFYRTFTIRDASGGAEILAGTSDLHNVYPVGCYVCVKLEGCAVGESRGVLQIGAEAETYENLDVDYFFSKVELDRRIFRSGMDIESIDIPVLPYSELEVSLCGTPVTVCGLQLVRPTDLPEAEPCIWSGYRMFEDAGGGRIYTYTNNYADFADDEVPADCVNITGILQYGSISGEQNDCFILKMRSREDCSVVVGDL